MNHANFKIVDQCQDYIRIRDLGPWDRFMTVTNDAEWVVRQLEFTLRGRRLEYEDSDGNVDILLVKDGRFAGFAPGNKRAANPGDTLPEPAATQPTASAVERTLVPPQKNASSQIK